MISLLMQVTNRDIAFQAGMQNLTEMTGALSTGNLKNRMSMTLNEAVMMKAHNIFLLPSIAETISSFPCCKT